MDHLVMSALEMSLKKKPQNPHKAKQKTHHSNSLKLQGLISVSPGIL